MSAEARYGHGYGMTPLGHAPGYCWCGAWAYDRIDRTTGLEVPGCPALAAILGFRPRSHLEARAGAERAGVDGSRLLDATGLCQTFCSPGACDVPGCRHNPHVQLVLDVYVESPADAAFREAMAGFHWPWPNG